MTQEEAAIRSFGNAVVSLENRNNGVVAKINKKMLLRLCSTNGEYNKEKFLNLVRHAEQIYYNENNNSMGYVFNLILHYGFYINFEAIPEEIEVNL